MNLDAWKKLALAVGELRESGDRPPTLREIGAWYTEIVLAMTGGDKSAAARYLGIDRRTLYRHLEREEIPLSQDQRQLLAELLTSLPETPEGGVAP